MPIFTYPSKSTLIDDGREMYNNNFALLENAPTSGSGIRSVVLLPTLPDSGYPADTIVFYNGKLYKNVADVWVAVVNATDLDGQITTSQIADGAIAAGKIALTMSVPIKVVTLPTLPDPTYPNDSLVVKDGELYRNASGIWTKAVEAVDIDGELSSAQIADAAVTTAKLANSAVTSDILAANAVTETKILDGAISSPKIVAGAITTGKLAAGAVTTNELAANSVVAGKIASGAITTDKLDAVAVTADKIAANAITSDKITANAITTAKIAAGAVTADTVAANAITAEKLTLTDLSNLAFNPQFEYGDDDWTPVAATTLTVVTGTPNSGKLTVDGTYQQSVTNGGAFSTVPGDVLYFSVSVKRNSASEDFNLGVIYKDSAGNSDVRSAITVDSTVTNSTWVTYTGSYETPSGSVTAQIYAYVSAGSAGSWEFTDVVVRRAANAELIVDGAVTANKIAANAITADKIDAGAITTDKLDAGAVTTDKITAGAITTSKLGAQSVAADNIQAGAVTAEKLELRFLNSTLLNSYNYSRWSFNQQTPNADTGNISFGKAGTGSITYSATTRSGSGYSLSTGIASVSSTPYTTLGDITVIAWVYPTSFSGNSVILRIGNGSNGIQILLDSSGYLKGIAYNGGSSITTTSSSPVSLNTWTMVTYAVKKGANQKVAINSTVYYDARDATYGTTTGDISIGSESSGTASVTGYIDELIIIDNAYLSDSEIAAINTNGGIFQKASGSVGTRIGADGMDIYTSTGVNTLKVGNISGKPAVPSNVNYGLWGSLGTSIVIQGAPQVIVTGRRKITIPWSRTLASKANTYWADTIALATGTSVPDVRLAPGSSLRGIMNPSAWWSPNANCPITRYDLQLTGDIYTADGVTLLTSRTAYLEADTDEVLIKNLSVYVRQYLTNPTSSSVTLGTMDNWIDFVLLVVSSSDGTSYTGDTTPPAKPTGLSTSASSTQVTITWTDPADSDLSYINVKRSTTSGSGYTTIASVPKGNQTYSDTSVSIGVTYYYVLTAVDDSSNESGATSQSSATPSAYDGTPPAVPTSLSATAGAGKITLSWTDPGDSDLASIRIKKSLTSGGTYTTIDTIGAGVGSYDDYYVTNGTTYYYKISAVDTSSNESADTTYKSGNPDKATAILVTTSSTPNTNETDIKNGFESRGYTVSTVSGASVATSASAYNSYALMLVSDYPNKSYFTKFANKQVPIMFFKSNNDSLLNADFIKGTTTGTTATNLVINNTHEITSVYSSSQSLAVFSSAPTAGMRTVVLTSGTPQQLTTLATYSGDPAMVIGEAGDDSPGGNTYPSGRILAFVSRGHDLLSSDGWALLIRASQYLYKNS